MDLQGGNILVRQLVRNPQARVVFQREFPGLLNSPLFGMAQNMSLNQVIRQAGGSVPRCKIQSVLDQLKEL